MMTVAEAAAYLRKSQQTILRWIAAEEFPTAVRVRAGKGYRYLIPRKAVLSKMELVGAVPNGTPGLADPATEAILERHGLA